MHAASKFRLALLMSAASAVLFACADTDISSPGSTTPVTPGGGGGGGGGGGSNTAVNLVPSGGCPSGLSSTTNTVNNTDITACTISGNVFSNLSIPAGLAVKVSGPTFIGQPTTSSTATDGVSATLTIGAGARLFGAAGSDYIVITRGSQINAQGSVAAPIRFTSAQAIAAEAAGNARDGSETNRAEWGGLVISGGAPINHCTVDTSATGGTAACQKTGEGSSGAFGGDNASDNSGTLSYVRVEYAGFRVNDSDELNGIAFQGVGNGTTVNHVQVHNNEDDGVEFFGGTVNVRNVILTGIGDDSMDWTDGWTGRAQYVLIAQKGDAADNAFEMDNRSITFNNLPRSNPIVSNFTAVGVRDSSASDVGLQFRAGSAGRLINGVVVDFNDSCLDIDDAAATVVDAGTFNSLFFDCPRNFRNDGDGDDAAAFALGTNNVAGTKSLRDTYFPGPNELAVTPTAVTDSFITNQTYVGAFGPSETPANNWAAGWSLGLFPAPACPTGTTDTGNTLVGKKVCNLSGTVTANTRLSRGDALIYQVSGPTFVGFDAGADPANEPANANKVTLTIDAGVTLFGNSGADYLVVTRGSKLEANGTSAAPVIMTARSDIEGTVTANARGLWGGVVINGRAPINHCTVDTSATGGTIGCQKSGEGSSGNFGGATAADNSGALRFLQVKHAGFRVNDSDELNGIAFQGVGNGTTVSHVQVHNNEDDGVEFFGGTVNAKYLVLTGIGDDSLDWTDGWVGRVQYVIVQHAADESDNGFEMDNRSITFNNLPRSNPIVSNFTAVGVRDSSASDVGLQFRAGSAGRLINGVVVDFNDSCLDIDDSAATVVDAGTFNSLFFDCPRNFRNDGDGDDAAAFALGANNVTGTTTLSGHTFITGTRGVVPAVGGAESLVTVTNPNAIDLFFDPVTYVGAVENAADNWWAGWTYSQ